MLNFSLKRKNCQAVDMHKFLGFTLTLLVVGVNGISLEALPALYPIVIPAEYNTLFKEALNSSIEYVFLYSVSFIEEN